MEKQSKRRREIGIILAMVAFAAIAKSISIDATKLPYSQVAPAEEVGVSDMVEHRLAALLGLVGMYRTVNGFASVPVGTTVKVTYYDGSKEEALVTCLAGSPCVQPVPGTQKAAPDEDGGGMAGGGGGGDMGDWGGHGGGIGGPSLGGGCVGRCNGDVEIGPIQQI
ncbi:hypothetical protein N5D13_00780 [Stenotrophomonas maltophilia]|uniref:hypothetical protein n=1 Tax=Stenotrophomonas maltophilia TaxID=40324 RepID=UPI002447D45A|nr:hypothetical protein [Stenotrophomonas maltophilia]EKT4101877.1 hypothetical protein [Stenotrophomonas maltophilia]MDH0072642.1 hypothetical protein [Stenotrophomonas maltophilia]MDH0104677.1 hypothetical protein [Stenotrophomonas maltophilia]MDH0331363.1 hypothetical protein [Stenotrophomonas maltophilia]MDH0633001.1 hypothetical protein [Stenotrophomonas maltophilia]